MSDVAILIPTKNRSAYLIRRLNYYASVNSPHPVYIGDASDTVHRHNVEDVVGKLKNKLIIHYFHWPGTNDRKTLEKLSVITAERYCAQLGDDDFFVPESLTKCAEFLEANPGYRTAEGAAAIFTVKGNGAYGEIEGVTNYWGKPKAVEETGAERILTFCTNYWVPQFAVQRTEDYRNAVAGIGEIPDRSFGEMLTVFSIICRGRSKFIDCLYLFREQHVQRGESDLSVTTYSIADWITDSDWNSSCKTFISSVSVLLAEVDKISRVSAEKVVTRALLLYLANEIENEEGAGLKTRAKDYIEIISGAGVRLVIDKVVNLGSRICGRDRRISLSLLTRRSSFYNSEFLSVKKIVES